jgi:hypothetical protein
LNFFFHKILAKEFATKVEPLPEFCLELFCVSVMSGSTIYFEIKLDKNSELWR